MKSIFRKVIFSLLVAVIVTVVSMPFAAESVQAAKCLNAGRLVDCDTIFGNRPKSQDSHTGPAIVPEPSSSQTVWWSGVSSDLSDAILQLSRQNRTIKQVAFTAKGGWLILFDYNGYWGKNVPQKTLDKVAELSRNSYELHYVAFTPNNRLERFTFFKPPALPVVFDTNKQVAATAQKPIPLPYRSQA